MAYGETILFQSWIKDSIIKRLRDCGCDDDQVEDCWNSFVDSITELHTQLKLARKTGNFTGVAALANPFLDLVHNLHAVDLMIYTKNLCQALKSKEENAMDRAANDLLKICDKYLTAPEEDDDEDDE